MGNKEILFIVEAISNEKGVDKDIIFEAVETALAAATRKRSGIDMDVRVDIDQKTGDYDTYRRWTVIDDDEVEDTLESPDREVWLSVHRQENAEAKPGDIIEEPMESIEFGRIAAQTARQVIMQKVREAERNKIAEAYLSRVGELVSGVVKRATRESIIIDLGTAGAEAMLPREQMIDREIFRPGDRVRAYLMEVRKEARGPQLILTRASNEFLLELFKIEVPEVSEELIEIKAVARDPGLRAKVAVKTNDQRLDPIGACVGMRGARVQAISGELNNERIDIVLWDDNPMQLVINAMSPAEVDSIVVDEDSHSMDIAVAEESLSQAIGRNGQNVRLASGLTGWTLNVMSVNDANEKNQAEVEKLLKTFIDKLGIDDETAEVLIEEGFASIEEIAYVPQQEMMELEGFDEEIVTELRQRAKDALLTQELADEAQLEEFGLTDELLNMEGMTRDLALKLAKHEILTMDDLAEQAVADLLEITTELNEKEAGQLIMTARAPWFAEDNKD
ncbi:Transcription termination/antitermination protein NusA [Piscirickettsia salmonis]|uniref:Transcription termination/antitermination protein NusA n=1 Tax=Piscirickettsia salmonis TaxID=1238 RepID=A0A1L6TF15_PISSA|nr:transcription termination factor NusA [Piscirickettsia salmonis]AKP72446.1 transcription elongation factor NusA [Piscirickettsia salmonis LF-89 = ATCC VR-1361]ALB24093.1 transcription termination factor NusA [Piscirickettsia salmonis]ALY03905.1 transcription elongation factor NusA [Piscirickettsia salmonis]AMA43466.1 transcription elongation factor NusA [Piscirickettsia salmonis]AOS35935.1 transcription elongation factor NusA [Piscirickettsia salmonis]